MPGAGHFLIVDPEAGLSEAYLYETGQLLGDVGILGAPAQDPFDVRVSLIQAIEFGPEFEDL